MPFGGPEGFTPAYLELGSKTLSQRAQAGLDHLSDCRLCPRDCGVDRLADRWSACKTGRWAVVTSAFPHHGEEDCLRGWAGSGTIFFGHCNLRCIFCQNYDISQGIKPPGQGISARDLAGLMLALQARGCHNINLVTPEHVVPQVLEALPLAVAGGLRLPIVYNTSAYDSPTSLELLDGIVDIYMPDLKLLDPGLARRWLKAEDYPETAEEAVREMHAQVGTLQTDERGLAKRGLLVRHLVMPGRPEVSRAVLSWIKKHLGPDTFVNLMAQYRPGGRVRAGTDPDLNRPLDPAEFMEARDFALRIGLENLG